MIRERRFFDSVIGGADPKENLESGGCNIRPLAGWQIFEPFQMKAENLALSTVSTVINRIIHRGCGTGVH
jgi:hypothetical protein